MKIEHVMISINVSIICSILNKALLLYKVYDKTIFMNFHSNLIHIKVVGCSNFLQVFFKSQSSKSIAYFYQSNLVRREASYGMGLREDAGWLILQF